MMYPYITLADKTEVMHSHVMNVNGVQTVEVHFERPSKERGFDSARCVLPSYQWKFNEGFSEADICFFDKFLHHNAHLLYRYAAQGGFTASNCNQDVLAAREVRTNGYAGQDADEVIAAMEQILKNVKD